MQNGRINVENIVEFMTGYIEEAYFRVALRDSTTFCRSQTEKLPRCELAATFISCTLEELNKIGVDLEKNVNFLAPAGEEHTNSHTSLNFLKNSELA